MRNAVALLSLVLASSAAEAAPKKGPAAGKPVGAACGVRVLPLAQGHSWTYAPVPSTMAPDKERERITPMQAKQIVVAVTNVETKGADTVVTLSETLTFEVADPKKPEAKIAMERKVTSTVTCNAKKFEVSPESFFFAGEPGGYQGMTIEKVERKKDSVGWRLEKGAIGEAPWLDEMIISWTQQPAKDSNAKLQAGKLEIERKFTPQDVEPVTTKKGPFNAEKLGIETTGRVSLATPRAPEGKPCTVRKPDMSEKDPTKRKDIQVPVEVCDLPANWIAQLWLADGVGMVQALNGYGHTYQLVDHTVGGAAASAPPPKK
jgi:hypothetical protein